jgi:hypothetical protein
MAINYFPPGKMNDMSKIVITHVYMDNKWSVVEKINSALVDYDIQIVLIDVTPNYDDNRSYRTGERQLDTRIDGAIMRRDAAPLLTTLPSGEGSKQ